MNEIKELMHELDRRSWNLYGFNLSEKSKIELIKIEYQIRMYEALRRI